MLRFLSIAAICAVLAACGSSVKLDTPPVEDRSGTTVGGNTGGAGQGGSTNTVGNGDVKKVDLGASAQGAAPAR